MAPPQTPVEQPRSRRRWLKFNLRLLMGLISIGCIGLAWIAHERREARKYEAAFRDIEQLFGSIPRVPSSRSKWVRAVLGDDSFAATTTLQLAHQASVTDGRMEELIELIRQHGLHFRGLTLTHTWVSDVGIKHIVELKDLELLDLSGTRVTDVGLAHLRGVAGLERLYLEQTAVTDAGLAHLADLTALRRLNLRRTSISDSGLTHLSGLVELEALNLGHCRVSDAGIRQLRDLRRLRSLCLSSCDVGDSGLLVVAEFPELRQLDLNTTKVTDVGLSCLKKLRRLESIDLGSTAISDLGVERFGTPARIQLYAGNTRVASSPAHRWTPAGN